MSLNFHVFVLLIEVTIAKCSSLAKKKFISKMSFLMFFVFWIFVTFLLLETLVPILQKYFVHITLCDQHTNSIVSSGIIKLDVFRQTEWHCFYNV